MATTVQPPPIDTPEQSFGSEEVAAEMMETVRAHGIVEAAGDSVIYTVEAPESPKYEGVGVIVPGFGGFKRTSRDLRHELALEGLTTVSFTPVRHDRQPVWTRLADSQSAHVETLGAVLADLPINKDVMVQLPRQDWRRHVLLPHSMGNLAAARYAEVDSGAQTEGIVSLAGVGLGSPSVLQLLETVPKGLPRALATELLPFLLARKVEITPRNVWRIIHYYASNPARTAGEMYACLSTDIRPTIHQLGAKGVTSAFISFEHDALIPPNPYIGNVVDYYTEMPDAGHMAPQLKAQRVARTIIGTLDALELAA
jgi:pimeloyl-ACP methyl ester carboxylesterase